MFRPPDMLLYTLLSYVCVKYDVQFTAFVFIYGKHPLLSMQSYMLLEIPKVLSCMPSLL